MKKIDIVNTAFINFKRRKTRSILTVLGVVIGVTSIVVMISLGLAINKSFDDSMGSISGLTTVNVYGGYDEKTGKQKPLNEETVTMLESLDNIIGVSPEINVSGKFGSGKYVGYADITGVKPEFLEDLGIKLPDDFDMEAFKAGSTKNITCIMGNEVPYQFRNPRKQNNHGGGIMMGGGMMWSEDGETTEREPPEVDVTADNAKVKFTFDWNYGEKPQPGQTVKKAKLYNVKVMHIINQEGYEHSYNAYIPLELAKKLKKEQEKQNDSNGMGNGMGSSNSKDKNVYSQIKVIATDMKHCDAIVNKVKEMGYQAHSMGEYIQQTKQMTNIIQLVLGGIGGISLLVAAIGITNTMIMSIYERTKEIGVMKVIGC
ncbi:MAG: ABC transporter permease, partial [Oscillospiraceae bacterium]